MRKVFFLAMLLPIAVQTTTAANGGDTTRTDRLNYKTLNFLSNIYSESHNPAALSLNKVRTLADVTLNGHLERGGFHAIDASSKHNDFSLDIAGLKQIGNFSLSGNIKYINSKDYRKKWNSSYMLTPENPFSIGDSVKSDVTTEEFQLHVGSAYKFSNSFVAGLKLKYTTGSLSDQIDPRPKTNAMHFFINPGAWYKLSDAHSVGLSMDFDIYRSDLSYTIVNNMSNYVYFLMKGMGDNKTFSTGDAPGYLRDYNGFKYGVNAQWNFNPGAVSNLLELGFNTNSENAKDGGSSYKYKGGDYSAKKFSLYDRLAFGSDALRHNFMLTAYYSPTEGQWYDQLRRVDTEHANRVYYEVMSKDKVHKANYTGGALEYRIDGLSDDRPDWSARAKVAIDNADIKHYDLAVSHQKYTMATANIEGTKFWSLRRLRLETTVGGFLRTTLGDPTFDTVRDMLETQYTAPTFEYSTTKSAGFNARAALNIPVRLYKTPTWITVYAQTLCRFYSGDNKYSNAYDGRGQAVMDFGLNLTL